MAKPRKVIRTKRLYTKRRYPRKLMSVVIFILLIVIVIALGFVVMNEWNKRFGKDAPNTSSSDTVSSDTVPSSEASSEASEISSEPSVSEAAVTIGKTRMVSAETLLANAADLNALFAGYKNEGFVSIAVELKPISGIIVYSTANEAAAQYKAISETPIDINAVVKAISDNQMTPVAVISALRDETAPHVSRNNSYAFENELQINWLDNSLKLGGKPWLNPYMENTRKYLADLTAEINAAGFNTIILQNMMFPFRYVEQLNTIIETPSRELILKQTTDEIKAAAPNATVYVSFDAQQLGINGSNYINTISTTLAPVLDKDRITEYLPKLGGDFDLSGADLTVQNAAEKMLSDIFTPDTSTGELLPIVKDDADMKALVEGIKNYIIY